MKSIADVNELQASFQQEKESLWNYLNKFFDTVS